MTSSHRRYEPTYDVDKFLKLMELMDEVGDSAVTPRHAAHLPGRARRRWQGVPPRSICGVCGVTCRASLERGDRLVNLSC